MATSSVAPSRGNRILDRLPSRERGYVDTHVEDVALAAGDLLCAAGRRIEHVYFPRQGVISLFATLRDAPDTGVGLIRKDGMFGLAVAAGEATSRLLATAQGTVKADRLRTVTFLELLRDCPGLRAAVLAYSHFLSSQLAQNAACIALHPARRRLARWMIDVSAGAPGRRIFSTQAATAIALGIRRPAVSRAAGALQGLGVIGYVRGEITILDRARLKGIACACSIPTGSTAGRDSA